MSCKPARPTGKASAIWLVQWVVNNGRCLVRHHLLDLNMLGLWSELGTTSTPLDLHPFLDYPLQILLGQGLTSVWSSTALLLTFQVARCLLWATPLWLHGTCQVSENAGGPVSAVIQTLGSHLQTSKQQWQHLPSLCRIGRRSECGGRQSWAKSHPCC